MSNSKKVGFLPQTDLHALRKDVRSYKNTIFDFTFFHFFEKMIHRTSDSPWRVTPFFLFFTSLRLFVTKYIKSKKSKLEKVGFLPQTDLHPLRKDVRSYKKYDFRLFIFFIFLKNKFIEHRILHEELPQCFCFFTSLRLFVQ